MASSTLPISPAGRRYGRFQDNPYHPARRLLALKPTTAAIPTKATTSQWMGKIRDQGQEGSCTGQMGAAIRDLLYRKLYAFEKDKVVAPVDFETSAGFVYKCNLIADGDLGQDLGSSIHQTFITLNQKGAPLEFIAPYSDKDYSTEPTAAQYAAALTYKGGAYHYLPDIQTMKQCIASGYSFGTGITVYESFEGNWSKPGYMPVPDVDTERALGGHAQHYMDYDDDVEFPNGDKGGFFVQNSWGTDWGINGCYWTPYRFVELGLVQDSWMIHLGPAWK